MPDENYNSSVIEQKNSIPKTSGSSRNMIKANYQTIAERSRGENGSQSHLMYSTLTSASQANNQAKFKEILKMKLSYEWKKLYRLLSMQDSTACGLISPGMFEKAAVQCGVYLTKEDMQRIGKIYSGQENSEGSSSSNMINYQKMSV
jgi:hypothetical protein